MKWQTIEGIADSAETLEAPMEMRAISQHAPASIPASSGVSENRALPTPRPGPTPASATSYDEALVLRDVEELSAIDSWRCGITAFGEDLSADVEPMSRGAEHALRGQYYGRDDDDDDVDDPIDSVSQVRSVRKVGQVRHLIGASLQVAADDNRVDHRPKGL